MRVTILVSDNTVIVDGRPLSIDCGAINPNIRVMNWWDTHGEVEFYNEPGIDFKRNGKLDSLTDFRDVIEAWQVMAQKIDNVPSMRMKSGFEADLSKMPMVEAARVLQKIESSAALKTLPLNVAVEKLHKIERDPELKNVPLAEAVRVMDRIKTEPKLNERFPGPALRELREIETDPELKNKPLSAAVDARKEKEENALPKFGHTTAPDEADLPKPPEGVTILGPELGEPPPMPKTTKRPIEKGPHAAPKPPPGAST